MARNSKSPFQSTERSLHSASGFGKPTCSPFPEPDKEIRDDAMAELMKSLKRLNDETLRGTD